MSKRNDNMLRRNYEENYRFEDYLKSAIDKAEQAISNISYSFYPEVNKEAIAKLEKAISIMEDVVDTDIFKPW